MADWADRAAAAIISVVYTAPNAREQIAATLRMVDLEGQRRGIEEARKVFNDVFAEHQEPLSFTADRIRDAAR